MPSVDQLRNRLLKKLYELFQLDQPDLDFGFYRIMHAKAQEVQEFIEDDLLKIVANEFGEISEGHTAELRVEYEKAIQIAKSYGAPKPEETEMVMNAKAKLDAAKDTADSEAGVYDHLYRFFERYYDNGDFISRRYYTRENSSKAAPFAVPYNGEEVKLHWANADQYYVKSAEYFSNFTFDLRQAQEVCDLQQEQASIQLGVKDESAPFRVHFRVVDATEGEHSNVKASDSSKRFFILHTDNPVALNDNGELVVNFEYRSDPEKTGQENSWRTKRNTEAVKTVLARLQVMTVESGEHRSRVAEYLRLLKVPAPTEKNKYRPLLSKYVNRYTARNTMDFFIHKDLGTFLRRELDFYIKNEVMYLDDIENADVPSVESYLIKIKVLRKIAGKLIDFLAQLEDFQRKLWLKKKFVVETNYCITLDRVPEELYEEVAANDAQCEEWIKLFVIDEIQGDTKNPGYSHPLTVEFLKANDKLVLDTQFFDENFKARLVASIENFDEQCSGLLVHSENFQALNLIEQRFRKQVRATYIDPPYNTIHSEIIYKNQYKHSSWLSLIANVARITPAFWQNTFSFGLAIDDYEFVNLAALLNELFPALERSVVVVDHHPQGAGGRLSRTHEYLILYSPATAPSYLGEPKDDYQERRNFMRSGTAENNYRSGRWRSFYALLLDLKTNLIINAEPPVTLGEIYPTQYTSDGYRRIYPINSKGEERVWRSSYSTGKKRAQDGELIVSESGTVYQNINHKEKRETLFSNWTESKFNAGTHGSNVLNDLGLRGVFDYPKSINTVVTALWAQSFADPNAIVLDYFAGSGTTGHAVLNLNRSDNGKRMYVLVEFENYFDTVTKPRIQKCIYSTSWSNGKPTSRHTGISHCFKYLRLESYEDTLNNLRFDDDPQRTEVVAANSTLREDYILRYLLDVETRNSQSLLNIDAFADPATYSLKVKKPGTDEYTTRTVDLIETFNYLIGLRVLHTSVFQSYQATFKRTKDPELPEDQYTKLVVDGRIQQNIDGRWWFRKVEGWIPKDSNNPNNGQRENVLIVWRKLTGNIEQDNLMLDEWFQRYRFERQNFEFDTIYVNGSNNLSNIKSDDENWKIHLIEEEFMKRMWSGEIV